MGTAAEGLVIEAGRARCWWCAGDEEYQRYHDEEWGRPVRDDKRLFEKVCLESFQSGLAWITILRKRENFRQAFDDFDMQKVARYNEADVERLAANAGIIRHRGKIQAAITNARAALALIEKEGSLNEYFWRFVPPKSERPDRLDFATLSKLATTPTSKALAKDLKARNFVWVGPTTVYAFMQAMGLVNDHLEDCWVRSELESPA